VHHDVRVPLVIAAVPSPVPQRRAALLLVLAATTQLIGQAWLRLSGAAPVSDGGGHSATWIATHVLLLVGAVALIGAIVLLGIGVGWTPASAVGTALVVVGQLLTVAVLALDLWGGPPDVQLLRVLDAWDFLAVVGLVVVLLDLRGRAPGLHLGAGLALLALALPPLGDLLAVVAAALVLVAFTVLAHGLVRPRPGRGPAWLGVATALAYVAVGPVSWQRAALAVVVVAWTVATLRTGTVRASAQDVPRTRPGSRRSPARRP
jgi:hypothetical protein